MEGSLHGRYSSSRCFGENLCLRRLEFQWSSTYRLFNETRATSPCWWTFLRSFHKIQGLSRVFTPTFLIMKGERRSITESMVPYFGSLYNSLMRRHRLHLLFGDKRYSVRRTRVLDVVICTSRLTSLKGVCKGFKKRIFEVSDFSTVIKILNKGGNGKNQFRSFVPTNQKNYRNIHYS